MTKRPFPDTERSVRITPQRRLSDCLPPTPIKLPSLSIEVEPPDLSPWIAGNTGIAGVHRFQSPNPGPHAAITALMHGNEYVGAIALIELLQRGITPKCGTLSLIFLNIDAFTRFCPANPILSRFVKEDMNRLWGDIATGSAAASPEQKRVRTLRPYIETVDCLLDLHSMLWPAKPLMLAGPSKRGLALAERIATPPLIVTDNGHKAGARLIDMPHFVRADTPAQACLLEAGQHWSLASLDTTRKTVARFLSLQTNAQMQEQTLPKPEIAHVTHRVTARTGRFCFTRMFPSGEMIAKRGTIIATDGPDEIRTPYDNCLLVMPNFRAARHHTAVRLAQIENREKETAGPERS